MKPKKNPKVDLNRNNALYFVIGLTLVLFTTWRVLKHKSYGKSFDEVEIAQAVEPDLDEEVPLLYQIKLPPPPAPPSAPVIMEVLEDTEEIEETVIQSTEMDQDVMIMVPAMHVDDVEVEEVEEEITVPFCSNRRYYNISRMRKKLLNRKKELAFSKKCKSI